MHPEEPIRFRAGEVELDGLVSAAPGATRACVVCHPHPLYGGDMRNSVVSALVDALRGAGIATLRFDFRGVGRSGGSHSGGSGEVIDALAALDTLASRTGLPSMAVAGYSFGALIALHAALAEPRVDAVAVVAPPLAMGDPAFATRITVPVALVAGDRDDYCPVSSLEALATALPKGRARVLLGADHFLVTREHEAAVAVLGALA